MSDVPVSAVEIEATGVETVTVDWEGIPVTVPAAVDFLELDTLEAFERGLGVTAVRGMIGSKAYDTLRAEYKKRTGRAPVARDLKVLMDKVAVLYGFEDSGE